MPVEQQFKSIVNNITAMVSVMEPTGAFTLPLHTADDTKNKYNNNNFDVTDDRYQVEQVMENMLSIVVDRVESRHQHSAVNSSKAMPSSLQKQQYSSISSNNSYNSASATARVSARSVTSSNNSNNIEIH